MPILGLFPTETESNYRARVNALAGGAESPATQEMRRAGELAKKQAFAGAYASRGNQALARRQAGQTAAQISTETGASIGMQRQRDIDAARSEQQRLEQERVQGINNLVGFGVRGAGMLLGGPAGGAAAGTATKAVTGGIQQALQPSQGQSPRPTTDQTMQGVSNALTSAGMGSPVSDEDVMSLAGPQQPAQSMRSDLQQYLQPQYMDESSIWQPVSDEDVMSLAGPQQPTPPLRRDLRRYVNPQFMRGVRNYVRR